MRSLPATSVRAPCYGIQSYGFTDQRKVETDLKVSEDRTGDLSSSLRKPRTSQLVLVEKAGSTPNHKCQSLISSAKGGSIIALKSYFRNHA